MRVFSVLRKRSVARRRAESLVNTPHSTEKTHSETVGQWDSRTISVFFEWKKDETEDLLYIIIIIIIYNNIIINRKCVLKFALIVLLSYCLTVPLFFYSKNLLVTKKCIIFAPYNNNLKHMNYYKYLRNSSIHRRLLPIRALSDSTAADSAVSLTIEMGRAYCRHRHRQQSRISLWSEGAASFFSANQ